jgi:hypothetical protein
MADEINTWADPSPSSLLPQSLQNQLGLHDAFSISNIIANVLFSGIGFVAFVYGKKMSQMRKLFLGLALMVFPYFVSNSWVMWGTGATLTAAIFFWKD